ncbi:hypothetical protein O6H91_05G029000 [Diphasiastrum complanatum]|uniref:Uncharacterized protein n=2 Tax=Diphasiastrum complanatum TaxID=34168 RepID=A0ACC2A8L2_DIPCM|nr:hypothetical protein O6H91_23G018800 [Diphasiastrum complanatum]KAJ7555260.1 hypothetical protein O6H91_05G029000 [Diphasiastrum complanatum]
MLRFPGAVSFICIFLIWSKSPICQAQLPASFIFGDSLVDAGNNNNLISLAKSNYAFNGIDFEGGVATGRFCNGRTVTDIIGQALGLPFAPAYMDPNTKGTAILKGVNYASGGGGILDETGANFIERISLGTQVQYFAHTRTQLVDLLGEAATADLLSKSLISFTIGANDYLNNYIFPLSPTPALFNPQQFQDRVVSTFRKHLIDVYNLGARKFVVAAVGPLGCIPYQLTFNLREGGSCAPRVNNLIMNFNKAASEMVLELGSSLPGANFVFADSYKVVFDIVNNPQAYGFQTADTACCGAVGPYAGLIPCFPLSPVCPDRSISFFWDPYHPSDAGNVILGNKFLDGDLTDAYPMNIRQLVSL